MVLNEPQNEEFGCFREKACKKCGKLKNAMLEFSPNYKICKVCRRAQENKKNAAMGADTAFHWKNRNQTFK